MEYSGFPRQDSTRALSFTRIFDAPRALVWKTWTDASQAQRWLGPRGFSASHWQSELRLGGAWRACLRRDADGKQLWQGGIYLEVVAPERLTFSCAWDDANQRKGHETRITLTFSEHQGKTTLGFRQEMFETVEQRDAHQQGWNSAFDRLADHLAKIQSP